MEYVPGGDVRTLLNNSGILQEQHTRFYIAEMFVAVTELHKLGYIHRDLKPENFLIDAQGHIKLTDFGLSKGCLSPDRIESIRIKLDAVKARTPIPLSTLQRRTIHNTVRRDYLSWAYSLVGSPDYMAPEILHAQSSSSSSGSSSAKGYDFLVDYWSLGCILFEFLAGYPPFAAGTLEEVWVNVYHWETVLERPVYDEQGEDAEFNISDEAWDLITRLISHRTTRINSFRQIKSHPFFKPLNTALSSLPPTSTSAPPSPRSNPSNIDWIVNLRSISPPFIPELTSETDVSYFDDFENPEDMELYKEVREKQSEYDKLISGGNGEEEDDEDDQIGGGRAAFVGFTFRHKDCKEWKGQVGQEHK
ncbi:kinase-like domain-containing protein [Paraphysoderma sedebokerense]|nr:kinase-like domain-containing protein [Paraphysoderma sedebokerense]